MSNPQISIIVPVYKVETYLKRCIESIRAQTFTDWELLLIDDGSPDTSGVLCDMYANADARIKAFHKSNGGVASARELGMQHARGNYSVHVDPDDWIDPDMLHVLFNEAFVKNADVVICDFMLEYRTRSEVDCQRPVCLEPDSCLRQLVHMELHGSLCNKLIRTKLYRDYSLHFPNGMNCWEDLYVCCSIMMHEVNVAYIPRAFYHYDFFSNDNSMVRLTNRKGLQAQILCVKMLQEQMPTSYIEELHEMKWLVLVTAFRLELLKEAEIRTLYPEINDWYIRKYGKDWVKSNFYGLSLVLDGSNFRTAKCKMKWTHLWIRIKNKFIHTINKRYANE